MGIDWEILRLTIGFAALGAALTFLLLTISRYLADDVPDQNRRTVRRSLLALLIHPVPTIVALKGGNIWYSVGGDEFALSIILLAFSLSAIALFSNVYFGFVSHVPAGRRAAFSGICVLVSVVLGVRPMFGYV